MDLRAAAVAMGVALLLAACGGADVSGVAASANAGSSGNAGGRCQAQATVVGGNMFVAEQGLVGVTLLSDGGLSPLIFDDVNTFGRGFMILYDNVFGADAVSNPQDKFGYVKPFPPGTVPGASTQVQLQPKGVPLQLWVKISDGNNPSPANSSATASIGKDVWPSPFPTARVTYGANDTATVTFFPTSDDPHFSVSVTNVFGTGCPSQK